MADKKLYVFQYNTDFELINTYKSILEASRVIGISNISIYKAITGERNLAGGYFWYRGDKKPKDIPQKWIDYVNQFPIGSPPKPVMQIDSNGTVVAEYSSIRKAAKSLNVLERGISLAANGQYKKAYGYRWVFIENDVTE